MRPFNHDRTVTTLKIIFYFFQPLQPRNPPDDKPIAAANPADYILRQEPDSWPGLQRLRPICQSLIATLGQILTSGSHLKHWSSATDCDLIYLQ